MKTMEHHDTIIGTITGTIFSILYGLTMADISHTIILSITGAVSGFLATLVLKWAIKKIKSWKI